MLIERSLIICMGRVRRKIRVIMVWRNTRLRVKDEDFVVDWKDGVGERNFHSPILLSE